jgi:hypothetical protein
MKESSSSFDGWGNFGADGETEGSEGGDGLVHLGTGRAEDLRLTNFNVDVVDIVSGKDTLAASRDLDAILSREGARDNSHPYDNGRGRLASVLHANWVQTCPLHSLGVQIVDHGGTDRGLPDLSERVQADSTRLLWKKVCFGARWLDPDVGARASDQKGLRG